MISNITGDCDKWNTVVGTKFTFSLISRINTLNIPVKVKRCPKLCWEVGDSEVRSDRHDICLSNEESTLIISPCFFTKRISLNRFERSGNLK